MLMQQLTSVSTIENSIDIRFTHSWYQEDIELLLKLIFAKLNGVNVIEKQLGADRETYRLLIENNYLTLNFDYYSQSCWLEPESEQDEIAEYLQLLTH